MSNKKVIISTLITITLFMLWGIYYPKDALTFLLVVIGFIITMLMQEKTNQMQTEDL